MQSRQLSAPSDDSTADLAVEDSDETGRPSRAARLSAALRRPALFVNITLLALALAGGVWAVETVRGGGTAANAATAAAGRSQPVAVRTVTESVSASGTVASSDVVAANFTSSGTVTKIYVKLGQAVTKGQELARIDATAADEQLQTAQDNLTAANDSLTRARDSADTSAIDSAQLQVDAAQDAVTTAQDAVDGVVLKAPITGTIIAQNGTVGASSTGSSGSSSGSTGGTGTGGTGGAAASTGSSSSSTGFMQVADLTKMEVDTAFPEADATKLKTGMTANVSWNALTGATATGTVTSVDPTATTSNNVVTYGVVVDLTTRPTGIRIGQSTTVVVTVASEDNVLAVPNAAVTTVGGFSVVAIAGQATPTRVQIGLIGDTFTQITSGLTAGQLVMLPTVTTTGTTTNPFGGGGGLGGLTGGGGLGGGGFGGGGFGGGRGAGGGATGGGATGDATGTGGGR